MRKFVHRLAAVIVVALAPMAIVMLATPEVTMPEGLVVESGDQRV